MKKAIYAGSFDPVTNGHVDIINRARRLFDEVQIAVIHNMTKTPLFSIEKRIEMIQNLYKSEPGIHVEGFTGLLADYVNQKQIFTLVRGLRAVSDFDYEFQMAVTNGHLDRRIETIFLMTDTRYSYISSSLIKQIARYKGNISEFVPPLVEQELADALS